MSIFKSFKNLIRKIVFNPFGYDIVPLDSRLKTNNKKAKVKPDGLADRKFDLSLYAEHYGENAIKKRSFYNVGAGPNFYHPAWTNVDHPSEWYGKEHVHIAWDMLALTALPIKDETAQLIYSSYALEHITDEACQNFLNEAHRALREGAHLRIIVPNVDIYYSAFRAGERDPFYKKKNDNTKYPNAKYVSNPNEASLAQNFIWTFASSVSELHVDGSPERVSDSELEKVIADQGLEAALDYCTAKCSLDVQRRHPGNHINWYHQKKLESMLRKAGFADVYRSDTQQSQAVVLHDLSLFDFRRPEIALYMEAIK
jgi:predicted SAM-dependent methyltransferase